MLPDHAGPHYDVLQNVLTQNGMSVEEAIQVLNNGWSLNHNARIQAWDLQVVEDAAALEAQRLQQQQEQWALIRLDFIQMKMGKLESFCPIIKWRFLENHILLGGPVSEDECNKQQLPQCEGKHNRYPQSTHSLCKVSHAFDSWWNHLLDSEGEDQETSLQKTIKPSTFPVNAHHINYLNLSDPISSSEPHSSSTTVFCNQAIFLQPQGG